MAFENVFGNINFSALPAAKQAQADRLQQAIGAGIAQANYAQEMDMKRRQLEQEAGRIDLKRTAEEGAMELAATGQTTPERIAALKAYQAFQRPMIDPYTSELIPPPNPLQSLTGIQPIQADALEAPYTEIAPSPSVPLTPQENARALRAQQNMDLMSGEGMTPDQMQDALAIENAMPDMQTNQAIDPREYFSAPLDMGRAGKQMETEFDKNVAMEWAKADIAQKKSIEKEKFDDILRQMNAVSLIGEMICDNRKTIDMPFAEAVNMPARFFASDQADAMDRVKQGQLELAAPLAKSLGVNPTDKDFEASLQRIVNLNSTKKGREEQLQTLLKRAQEKTGVKADYKPPCEQALQILKKRGVIQ